MNYDQPRQREHDKRWDYTSLNRRTGTHAIGYCRALTNPDLYDPEHHSKFHTDGHATAEEARACYRRFNLDNHVSKREATSAHKCLECGEWTPKFVEVGSYMGQMIILCDDHQTPELIDKHYKQGDSMHS